MAMSRRRLTRIHDEVIGTARVLLPHTRQQEPRDGVLVADHADELLLVHSINKKIVLPVFRNTGKEVRCSDNPDVVVDLSLSSYSFRGLEHMTQRGVLQIFMYRYIISSFRDFPTSHSPSLHI